jgi:hypothetical protein
MRVVLSPKIKYALEVKTVESWVRLQTSMEFKKYLSKRIQGID